MDSIELVRTVAASLNLLDAGGALVQIDSLSAVDLVTELEEALGVEISAEQLRAEAFRSLESVAALVDEVRATASHTQEP